MIIWSKDKTAATSRYDALVGILHVGTQENGEGWWNWWVATAEQGICAGEHMIIESGGCPTLKLAKAAITRECEIVARRILAALAGSA